MFRSFLVAAVPGALLLLSGCSSDTDTKSSRSGSSSSVSPPSVDMGDESAPPEGSAASSSSSASNAASAAKPAPGGWGTLKGRFVYDGPAPTPEPLSITKDAEFCGKHNLVSEELVVNAENGGIRNIAVMLYLKPREKAPEAHPDYADKINEPVKIDNANCRFEPHVVVMQAGQKLIIGNKDPVGHNTNASLSRQPFNELLAANQEMEKPIDAAERLPAPISCNIHPWMRGYLVVTEHPYAAVTDENGEFTIENLPTGEWTFQIWQEKSGYLEEVQRDGKAQKWDKGRTTFAINEGDNDLGEIKVAPAVFEK